MAKQNIHEFDSLSADQKSELGDYLLGEKQVIQKKRILKKIGLRNLFRDTLTGISHGSDVNLYLKIQLMSWRRNAGFGVLKHLTSWV